MEDFNSSYSGAQIENSIRIGKELSEIGSGNIPKLVNGAVENAIPGADFGLPNLTGSTNPTSSTVGVVGQMYVNTTNGAMYVCTNATASTYTWSPVSGGGIPYAECTNAASATTKNVPLTGITLESGKIIAVRFTNGNTASSISLIVNGSTLKAVLGSVPKLSADGIMFFVYNGTNWVRHEWDDTYTGYVSKTASTASVKGADGYSHLSANQYFSISFLNANTYEGLVRLALGLYNGSTYGTYSVYINGTVSSATNFSIPRGSYIAFFDGANVYINTNGTIPGVPTKTAFDTLSGNVTDISGRMTTAEQAIASQSSQIATIRAVTDRFYTDAEGDLCEE